MQQKFLISGKNAEVSRTLGVCHVTHVFFGSSLSKIVPRFITVGYMVKILEWEGLFGPPSPQSVSSSKKAHPEQG